MPFVLLISIVIAALVTGKLQQMLDVAPFLLVFVTPVGMLWLRSLFIVSPNESRLLTYFGKYSGSVRTSGFWFANLFASKTRISLPLEKVHGHEPSEAQEIATRALDRFGLLDHAYKLPAPWRTRSPLSLPG